MSRSRESVRLEEKEIRVAARLVREKHRRENRQAWADFHGHMNVLHTSLALEHADKRSRLMLERGERDDGPPPPPEAA